MRTRYKKYSDYGMSDVDVALTNDFLNNLDDDEKFVVNKVIKNNLPEHVGAYVSMALIHGYGYGILRKLGMLYDKADFYGYKRKGMFIVDQYRKGKLQ